MPHTKPSARIYPGVESVDKPSLTNRPPRPVSQHPKEKSNRCIPGCSHKYEILEYPGVKSAGYLFYCIFCLDFQEKFYTGGGSDD